MKPRSNFYFSSIALRCIWQWSYFEISEIGLKSQPEQPRQTATSTPKNSPQEPTPKGSLGAIKASPVALQATTVNQRQSRKSIEKSRSNNPGSSRSRQVGGTSSRSTRTIILLADRPGAPVSNYEIVFGHVRDLSSAIFGAGQELRDSILDVDQELRNPITSTESKSSLPRISEVLRQSGGWTEALEWGVYEKALFRDRITKGYVIAAMMSMIIWQSIEKYEFFSPKAIEALKAAQKLGNEPDIPYHISQDIEVDTSKTQTVAESILNALRIPHNHSSKADVVLNLVKQASTVALQLKKYPGEVYATFNPTAKSTLYATQKARCPAVYYLASKGGSLESEKEVANTLNLGPQRGYLVYFPEIMLKLRQRSGAEFGIIRRADYHQIEE